MKIHRTRTGERIPLSELTDDHLQNILRWHHRRAAEGVLVGDPGHVAGDVWAERVFDEEALALLGHAAYVEEARRRGLEVCCEPRRT